MKYFKELSENPKIKSYFDSLIGLPINEVCKKLGYWWLCRSSHISFEHGSYVFERAAGGRIELRTENNIVVSENHNGMAMLFAKRDINNENALIMEKKGIKYEFYAVELDSYYGAIITIIAPTKREVEKRAKELGRENYVWEIRKHRIDTLLPHVQMLK